LAVLRVVEAVAQELSAGAEASTVVQESLAHASALLEPDRLQAIAAADAWAAEHLELLVADPAPWIQGVRAGSVFVGANTPTALGDYAAGPTHVLPTSQSSRALSGLTKLHFLRTFSVTEATEVDPDLFSLAARLAELEGLPLHARSLTLRAASSPRWR
jgi:histidinol dehydrogenase